MLTLSLTLKLAGPDATITGDPIIPTTNYEIDSESGSIDVDSESGEQIVDNG